MSILSAWRLGRRGQGVDDEERKVYMGLRTGYYINGDGIHVDMRTGMGMSIGGMLGREPAQGVGPKAGSTIHPHNIRLR